MPSLYLYSLVPEQGFVRDLFSWGEGNVAAAIYGMRKHAQSRGVWGHAPDYGKFALIKNRDQLSLVQFYE